MAESASQVMRTPISWNIEDFVGNTDRSIITTLLRRNGASETMIEEMTDKVLEKYLKGLDVGLQQDGAVKILPGVKRMLDELQKDERFTLGLVTGNVLEGARIKLRAENLFSYFPIGAFGDDAVNREHLPPIAIQRAEKYYGYFFDRKDIWIVGDSTNDIKCAKANHLHSLVVATGHIKSEELQAFHPTALLENFSKTDKVINIILSS
jgi:phosphoglycolate phosphatase-like HAD superfamily hydrolase